MLLNYMSSYSGLRRLGVFFLAAIVLSCVPDTFLSSTYDDKGKVIYTVDGSNFSHIIFEANGIEDPRKFYGGDKIPKSIIPKDNSVKVTAYKGNIPDPTPAEDSFYSPTDGEAKEIIDGVFLERGYTFLDSGVNLLEKSFRKNARFSFGSGDDFTFDYWGRGMGDFVVEYVGYEEDALKNARQIKPILDEFGFPNLFLYRLPEEEIRTSLELFLTQNENLVSLSVKKIGGPKLEDFVIQNEN